MEKREREGASEKGKRGMSGADCTPHSLFGWEKGGEVREWRLEMARGKRGKK